MSKKSKFEQSTIDLKQAMVRKKQALHDHILYAGIAKCFEVCLEYGWKELKRKLEREGIEAYSPKEIVKVAGKSGLIDDVEMWIECINIRNIAVHDYLGVTKAEYLSAIERFIPLAARLSRILSKDDTD